MTKLDDDFTTVATPPWMQVLSVPAVPGTITAANSVASSAVDGDYLVQVLDEIAITGTAVGPPATEIALATPHGYAVATWFQVCIEDTFAGVSRHVIALAHASDPLKFIANVPLATTGSVRLNVPGSENLTVEQDVAAIVDSTAEGLGSFALLWMRFDPRGGPALTPAVALRAGYGVALEWRADGARFLAIQKIDPVSGAIVQVAEKAVTLNKDDAGSDLGVKQLLSGVTHTLEDRTGVSVRAYLNEQDTGNPTLEWIDRGISHKNPGVWAVAFGKSTIGIDVVMFSDEYLVKTEGDRGPHELTVIDVLKVMDGTLGVGGNTGIERVVLLQALKDELAYLEAEAGGDRAWWLKRFEVVDLEVEDATAVPAIYILPYDVRRVQHMLHPVSKREMAWQHVGFTDTGRMRISAEFTSLTTVLVDYVEQTQTLLEDTDKVCFPPRWVGLLAMGASIRIQDAMGFTRQAKSLRNSYSGDETQGGGLLGAFRKDLQAIERQRHARMQTGRVRYGRFSHGRLEITGFSPYGR